MAARPQNIGIKAIEIYFPSQVRFPLPDTARCRPLALAMICPAFCSADIADRCQYSMWNKPSSKSSMALARGSTQSASARPK